MDYRKGKKIVKTKMWIKDMLMITLGCILISFATTTFLLPHQLSYGGFTGLATLLYYLFNMHMGLTIIILNIPLFIIALFKVDKKLFFRSLYGMLLTSILIDNIGAFIPDFMLTTDKLLASIYGGLITGLGVSLIFCGYGTTGGSDLLSFLIKRLGKNVNIGSIVSKIDIVIVTINVIFLKNIEIALYSAISIYLLGKVVDLVYEKIGYRKVVFIITKEHKKISKEIKNNVFRGITGISSRGMFTEHEGTMLMCVADNNEITKIKEIALSIDKSAFIVMINAKEVIGKGFNIL